MAQPQPTQRQPEPMETRPPRVTVPRLSVEETQRRAGAAFDAARDAVLRSQFRPPPAAEINAFKRMVEARLRQGDVDIGAVLNEYSQANPNSSMARYNRIFGGDTSWLLSADGTRIGLQRAAFNQLARSYVDSMRTPAINALVTLNNPRNRSVPVPASSLDQAIVASLQQSLTSHLRTGRTQLPATVAHDPSQQALVFNTTMPPPDQVIGEDEFRRRPGKG